MVISQYRSLFRGEKEKYFTQNSIDFELNNNQLSGPNPHTK
jgi:hypothetical protein